MSKCDTCPVRKKCKPTAQLRKQNKEWFYSDIVKEHFFHPRNLLVTDEDVAKFKFDGRGEVGSSACGDVMEIWIKVRNGKIKECKWRTFGCASAIASTSMLSVMVTEKGGVSLEQAKKIKPQDIMKRLGGLPKIKIHCSVLGDQALRLAIKDYERKKK